MHFSDLSKRYRQPKTLHVGWLDGSLPFETARPAKWLVRKLWSCCECSVMHAGGFHQCNLPDCPGPAMKLGRERRLTLRKIQEQQASFRTSIHSGILSGLPKDRKAALLSDLDQGIKDGLRGYSTMILGVHPDTGERMRLGYAEIRVFGKPGKVYAAPNMIYHYVTVHHYKPPAEFVQALKDEPCPPDPKYVDRLFAGFHPAFVKFEQALSKGQMVRGSGRRRKSVRSD
jgi:hypothetical protein